MAAVEDTLILVILAIAIGSIAGRLRVPYPIALVLGGLALGFIRSLPNLEFDPQFVFFFFLPPLLYHAAVFTSWRDFRANLKQISLLAVGLVAATTAATAAVAHAFIPEMPWAAAFALGAIVSPPDAICATAAMRGSRVPRQLITVIEGESLVNDATGLIIYKYAVAAAMTGAFSFRDVGADFLIVGPGGIAIGALLGFFFLYVHRQLADPMIETMFSLAIPFAVYLAAEKLQTSGVLAVVAAGLVRGWYSPEILSPQMRMRAFAAWDMVVFIMNSLVFILIGSELDDVLVDLPNYGVGELLLYAGAIAASVIGVRFVWVFASAYLALLIPGGARRPPDWRHLVVLAWSGMRGVVSLAAALALPLTTAAGQPFPARELIAFLTFVVIFVTLVIQGMTIAPLARLLGVKADGEPEREERLARRKTADAALAALERHAVADAAPSEALDAVKAEIARRYEELSTLPGETGPEAQTTIAAARRSLMLDAIAAQRQELIRLRREKVIGDDVLHRIEHDLDLHESMLA